MHPIYSLVLKQKLIILRDGNEEEDRRDILEAVDPFLAFRPLTTDIEHPIGKFTDDEGGLRNASGLDT